MKFISMISIIILILSISLLGPTQISASPINSADATLGEWSCWDDGTIDPCHDSMYSISMDSSNNGWSVGENGAIFHWDGNKWAKIISPTTSTLNAVEIKDNNGWAVGDEGTILRWDGSEWSQQLSPTDNALFGISLISSTNAWVAGWNIYHWDGSGWQQTPTPNNNSVALDMVPASNGSDGWAVGWGGSILRWNGVQWSRFSSPTRAFLEDVVMISHSDGWIVGSEGTFLHWNGSIWSAVDFPGNPFASIWGIDAASTNDVWAIGFDNGGIYIYHWNGIAWSIAAGNSDAIFYEDIAVTPGTAGKEAWVVGTSAYITRWNGSNWIPVNEPYTKNVTGINMLSTTNGWAFGNGGVVAQGNAIHWTGSEWLKTQAMSATGGDFFTDSNGTTGWGVGWFGRIYQLNDASWSLVASPVNNNLNAVDMLSTDEAWAVGIGTILHYTDSEWITVTVPTTNRINDISMISPTNGWAVGEQGMILKWDGISWQINSIGSFPDLTSIKMVGSSGWIVGEEGKILRWDGMIWSPQTSPTTSNLNDVELYAADEGWAVGNQGTVLHWNGTNWTQVNSPSMLNLQAIAYSTLHELWAAGSNGLILHYEFHPTLTINFSTGSPGSFFTISGSQYPPNQLVQITVNGQSIGSIQSSAAGTFNFILSTSNADEGMYSVTAAVNPHATVHFILDNDGIIRPQEGNYVLFDVPAGIAYTQVVNLPIALK